MYIVFIFVRFYLKFFFFVSLFFSRNLAQFSMTTFFSVAGDSRAPLSNNDLTSIKVKELLLLLLLYFVLFVCFFVFLN